MAKNLKKTTQKPMKATATIQKTPVKPIVVKKILPSKPAKLDAAKLADDRAEIERELQVLREALQELPEVSIEEADPALIEREKNLALVHQLERRLEEIELVKKAAKKGKYGICERCGKIIDPERLEIFPEARYCVKCKTEMEHLARRTGR